MLGVETLVLECIDESDGEIWDWRREIKNGDCSSTRSGHKIKIEGVVENFDGDVRSLTRSG